MMHRKLFKFGRGVSIASVGYLIFMTHPSAAQVSLFQDASIALDTNPVMEAIVAERRKVAGVLNVRVVRNRTLQDLLGLLRKATVSTNARASDRVEDQIEIKLFDSRNIRVVGRALPRDLEKGIWFGDVVAISDMPGTHLGSVSLSISDSKILGSISIPTATYEIRPESDNLSSIIEVDTSKAPPDDPAGDQKFRGERRGDEAPRPASDPNVTYVAKVLVAFTAAAKANIEGASGAPSVEQWSNLRITEANQSYSQSAIKLQLELVGVFPVDYVETGNWNVDRDHFFHRDDGVMDDMFSKRDEKSADISLLLFNNPSYCGEALGIKVSAESAFAVVHTASGCTAKYSLAHEVGHLFGAEHDKANASTPPSYAWAHGHIEGNAWRTMMAYAYGCNPCTRLLYWSSPLIQYGSIPMGSASAEDNARVLRENARAVSEFR